MPEGDVAALEDGAKNETHDLDGLRRITIKEVAETVNNLIEGVKIEYAETRPGDFKGRIASADKALKELTL